MAPTPKPPGQRARRNKDQPKWRQLPADGRAGEAPPLPGEPDHWLVSTRAWWETIWASPMATAWIEADVDPLARLARLKDDFDRGEVAASALSAMQQLEDRYGLSPKSRRTLQWEVSQASREAEPEVKAPPRPRRRLRAVDPKAG